MVGRKRFDVYCFICANFNLTTWILYVIVASKAYGVCTCIACKKIFVYNFAQFKGIFFDIPRAHIGIAKRVQGPHVGDAVNMTHMMRVT